MSDRSPYREHTARRDYQCLRECGDPRLHGRDFYDCPRYKAKAGAA